MVFLQCVCPGLPALGKALRDPLLVFKIGTKHRLDWAKLTAIAWHAACFPWKMLQTLLGQLSANVTACQQPGLHTGWDVCPQCPGSSGMLEVMGVVGTPGHGVEPHTTVGEKQVSL